MVLRLLRIKFWASISDKTGSMARLWQIFGVSRASILGVSLSVIGAKKTTGRAGETAGQSLPGVKGWMLFKGFD
jgi:hypothetical protein